MEEFINNTDMIYEICKNLSFYDITNLYSALNGDTPNIINKLLTTKIGYIMNNKMDIHTIKFTGATKNIYLDDIINNIDNMIKCNLMLTPHNKAYDCYNCDKKLCSKCMIGCRYCYKKWRL